MWGLDAIGPFRTAPGGYKHILVAVDKFTKWIEVRPVAKVTLEEAVKFIGDIKHHFGMPKHRPRRSLHWLGLLVLLPR
jgi:hypothetical protein